MPEPLGISTFAEGLAAFFGIVGVGHKTPQCFAKTNRVSPRHLLAAVRHFFDGAHCKGRSLTESLCQVECRRFKIGARHYARSEPDFHRSRGINAITCE